MGDEITLCLAGDVMLGRGIDQVQEWPSEPALHEPAVGDARTYVALAEAVNGPIPHAVAPNYVWGDALEVMAAAGTDRRLINLETAITRSDDWQPKGINYRMHPRNVAILEAARIDLALLANNHVLDWGAEGLRETLLILQATGIGAAGAGLDAEAAQAPAILCVPGKGRVVAWAMGAGSSGIPAGWNAGADRPGVNRLPDLTPATAARQAARIARERRPGDVTIASIHWGGNWGYSVPSAERAFAHALIDAGGVDLVFGHSSHHPKGIELHQGRPIVYGAGDLINDYEGIDTDPAYRSDLVCLYLAGVAPGGAEPPRLRVLPFHLRRFRLERAGAADEGWFERRLGRECAALGATLRRTEDGGFELGG
jgi:poly-gamma-glutamate capsule biosynthesis protein CapA/YwtB (metallophosphatase superfamily)